MKMSILNERVKNKNSTIIDIFQMLQTCMMLFFAVDYRKLEK